MKADVYTVGGTVQAGPGIYLPRKADQELLQLCGEGTFAYILTARQMGKSSLMIRTAQELADAGTRTALLDLTKLGVQATADSWYLGILVELTDQLFLSVDVLSWWAEHSHLPIAQRLVRFCLDVVLEEISEPVVVFFDEIDTTLSLDFSDDFYAAIRAIYNARAQHPAARRLTFVLIGVATPSDLIRDTKRTPFNIGTRVELGDFTPEEALPLAGGFGLPADEARQVLQRILSWTNGHPYLTQRFCRALVERGGGWDEPEVAQVAEATFFREQSEKDNHLQFVRDMLISQRSPGKVDVLRTYRDVRRGKSVNDDNRSPVVMHLKLAGVVRAVGRQLIVRNRIYATVFNLAWVYRHWPPSRWASIPRGYKLTTGLITLLTIAFLLTSLRLNSELQLSESRRLEAETAEGQARLSQGRALSAQETAEAGRAEAERVRQASSLAFNALTLLNQEPEQALLVAIEAATRDRSVTTDDALRQALTASYVRHRLTGHEGSALAAVFSVDTDFIFSGGEDNTIRIWSIYQGAETGVLRGHTDQVVALDLSPDGTTLVSASFDGTIRTWNAKNYFPNGVVPRAPGLMRIRDPQLVLRGHEGPVWNVAWNRDGSRVASAGEDGTVRVWSTVNGEQQFVLRGHDEWVKSVDWSPDGIHIVSSGDDGSVRIWNTWTGELVRTITTQADKIWAVRWSPDGKLIAYGDSDGKIFLWDVQEEDQSAELSGHQQAVLGLDFVGDNSVLLSAGDDGTVRMWSLWEEPVREMLVLRGHEGWVRSAAFSRPGGRVVSAGSDGTVRYWDWVNNGAASRFVFWEESSCTALGWNADNTILTACNDDRLRVWNPEKSVVERTIEWDNGQYFYDASQSQNGERIAANTYGPVTVWDSTTGKLLQQLPNWSNSFALSPDGSQLAMIISSGRVLQVWDTADGSMRWEIASESEYMTSLDWSPDSKWLAVAGNGALEIYDARKGSLAARKAALQNTPEKVIWSPDSEEIMAISADYGIQLWKRSTLEPGLLYSGHNSSITTAAWSPNGTWVASLDSATVRVWNTKTGRDHILLRNEHNNVWYRVLWSPKSDQLLLNDIEIHDIDTDKLIAIGRERVTVQLTPKDWQTYSNGAIPLPSPTAAAPPPVPPRTPQAVLYPPIPSPSPRSAMTSTPTAPPSPAPVPHRSPTPDR